MAIIPYLHQFLIFPVFLSINIIIFATAEVQTIVVYRLGMVRYSEMYICRPDYAVTLNYDTRNCVAKQDNLI